MIADRIPYQNWMNSQLSIARHYGGCTVNGKWYIVDRKTGDLVREDIFKANAKAEKNKRAALAEDVLQKQKKLW